MQFINSSHPHRNDIDIGGHPTGVHRLSLCSTLDHNNSNLRLPAGTIRNPSPWQLSISVLTTPVTHSTATRCLSYRLESREGEMESRPT